ncbi:thiopeptide maturation pyridine synthase [Microtetraspora glauca]|uniref:Thiopeptide maturation pyridine synthase n=1 Tax=Microtetraspora glauca TaxID=1996 RepID=A0ABV3G8D0_MICGL
MSWESFHIHYHGVQDDLILDGVRPLLARLRGQVEGAFYVRHWKRGPHVRVNVYADARTVDRLVWPAVQEVIGGFLKRQPSTARLVPEEYLALHRRLADLEDEPGPLLPWYQDNSVRRAEYDRRLHTLGGIEAAELLADFYAVTTDLAFQMTDAVRRGGQRLGIAFDLMVATAHALSGIGVANGFVSFRSHAEAFLELHPEGRGLRHGWEEHRRRNAGQLAARLRAVLAALDAKAPDGWAPEPDARLDRSALATPYARAWVEALAPFRPRAARYIEEGRLSLDPDGASRRSTWTGTSDDSPFHRELYSTPAWAETRSATWFTVYRLMTNYTYLHLTRLGVTPVERYLLCHLIAGTVEDHFGVSALDVASVPVERVPVFDSAVFDSAVFDSAGFDSAGSDTGRFDSGQVDADRLGSGHGDTAQGDSARFDTHREASS